MSRRFCTLFGVERAIVFFVIALLDFSPGETYAADVIVKASATHQTMIGFGASVAWYEDQLAAHPRRNEIYQLIFKDLGLDILRLRNTYRNTSVLSGTNLSKIVTAMDTIAEERPRILITSWSPPANLKSNNSTENGGTLKKDTSGKYVYADFAKYWADAIVAHSNLGIVPDYIGIQNEPDYTATWESCRFGGTETSTYAGYNRALDSVYAAIQKGGLQTKIIGPEPIGIGYNAFQNFANSFHKDYLDGYAYHLYHGESDNVNDNHNPDLFNRNLSMVATSYPGKPIWVTEYDRGDWLNTVWLIHNCVVYGNVSAYLWWELVWVSGGKPLIQMGSNTYTISKYYWAFRHFAKFVSSGWKRVTAEHDTVGFRISAFVAPDGKKLSVVVINRGSQAQSKSFDIQDFSVDSGTVVRTSDTESGVVVDSGFDGKSSLNFPARSITTISFSGNVVTGVQEDLPTPMGFSLSPNYPNPFNPTTTVAYSVGKESFVSIKIFDLLGQEVKTAVHERAIPGKHTVRIDASDLTSGVYFYQIVTNDFVQSHPMVLIK